MDGMDLGETRGANLAEGRSVTPGRRGATVAALLALAVLTGLAACGEEPGRRAGNPGLAPAPVAAEESPNVVLIVTDGFGVGAWSIARAAADSADGFAWLDAPDGLGFLDALGPRASAAAWATGRTAAAGAPDSLERTFFQEMRDAGRALGVVTTGRVTALPSSWFLTRTAGAASEAAIAEQLVGNWPDVLLGGGARNFVSVADGGRRKDGRDLLAEAESAGVAVLRRLEVPLPSGAPVLGLFARSELPHELDRREAPALEDLAVAAVNRLRQEGRPWFLLVEEALLEPAARDHDGPGIAANGRRLARTVAAVLREIDLDETLVVLASAGATGNPALREGARPDSLRIVNASIETLEARVFGGAPWRGTPRSLLAAAGPVLDAGARHTDLDGRDLDRLLSGADAQDRRTALGDAVSRRFGIAFLDYEDQRATPGRAGRTGEPVPVRAWGPRATEVAGLQDHAALGRWLRRLMDLSPPEGSVDTAGQDR